MLRARQEAGWVAMVGWQRLPENMVVHLQGVANEWLPGKHTLEAQWRTRQPANPPIGHVAAWFAAKYLLRKQLRAAEQRWIRVPACIGAPQTAAGLDGPFLSSNVFLDKRALKP
jgi:hypothetical protein